MLPSLPSVYAHQLLLLTFPTESAAREAEVRKDEERRQAESPAVAAAHQQDWIYDAFGCASGCVSAGASDTSADTPLCHRLRVDVGIACL